MLALDTNIVVRFLVRDDERQALAVRRRFKEIEKERGSVFIPIIVVLETIWVLDSAYSRTRSEILNALEVLREMSIVKYENDALIDRFFSVARSHKGDLPDLLIALVSEANGCHACLTFDKVAAKWYHFFEVLE